MLRAVLLFLLCASVAFAQADKAPSLNTRDVDLYSVIEYISKRFNKVIIPDENLLQQMKGKKAKIIMPPSIKPEDQTFELWKQIFENLLTIYGYTYVEKGDVYRLVQIPNAQKLATPMVKGLENMDFSSERIVTAVHVLKYITADDTRAFWSRVSQVGIPPMVLPDKRTLVVTTHESAIKSFLELLALIDVPSDEPTLRTYELERTNADVVKGHVQAYINLERARQQKAPKPEDQPFILSDPRTNRLMVSAIPRDHEIVKEIIEFLDADLKSPLIFRNIEIYRLKNSDSKVMADKLGKILKPKVTPGAPDKKDDDIPTIVPFEEQNALIISVEKQETYNAIVEVIKKLDVKRNQVYLASTIIEVGRSAEASLGAELGALVDPKPGQAGMIAASGFGLSTPTVDLTADPAKIARTPNPPSSGAILAVPQSRYDMIPVVLRAAASNSKINVLATPSIICDDNEKAIIEINEQRSTTTTQVVNGSTTTSTGQPIKAGTILTIRPTISSDSFLRLEIDQNVDRFIPDPAGQNRDVMSTRHANTVVTIPNKTSVVIGGLTRKQRTDTESKVPGLGSIPIIGFLFRATGNQKQDETLYFFITPEIISNFGQMSDITKEQHKEFADMKDYPMRTDKRFLRLADSRKDKTWQDLREDQYLVRLQEFFSREHLRTWVPVEKRQALANRLLEPGVVGVDLLPADAQEYFNAGRLDESFYATMREVHAAMEQWTELERKSLVARLYVHIAQTLRDGAHEDAGELKKRKSGAAGSGALTPSGNAVEETPAPVVPPGLPTGDAVNPLEKAGEAQEKEQAGAHSEPAARR